jgi:penicillin-binding protein 1B
VAKTPVRSKTPARSKILPRWAGVRVLLATPSGSWGRRALVAGLVLVAIAFGTILTLWISYGHLIDTKLAGEARPVPRVFGRPFELRTGEWMSQAQLVQRLNDVGYAQAAHASAPGEFSLSGLSVIILPRGANADAQARRPVRVDYAKAGSTAIGRVSVAGRPADRITLEAPLLATLAPGERKRYVRLTDIPKNMVNAVLAIEDRRFYEHPGVDPIGALGALVTDLRGNKPYLVGGSTLTQQIVKNTFLTPEKTLRRKLQEQFMALVLESRFSKDQILELYLNDVVLGQRGPFEIHGVSEASRLFFGKDVRNLTLAEAATIAGVIQSPSRLSPFRNADRARERRNVVLREMSDGNMVPKADAERAMAEPLVVSTRALENEAPYFVDYVSHLLEDQLASSIQKDAAIDIYTTLDLHLQRLALESVAEGLAQLDKQLAARKRTGQAQVALIAADPRTGEILAMVGGRGYNQSQYNRAVAAKRQPGSVFKPFVYLTAFEAAAAAHRTDLTPATIMADEPTTFKDGDHDYTPANYQNEYDGPITLRKALALSRNIVALKVAEQAGYDKVAALWTRLGVGDPVKAYPSIALGVFEVSPIDMTQAYTVFANQGRVRPLRSIDHLTENGKVRPIPAAPVVSVARADTTYLVLNMMRSVLDEGTGAGARRAGFTLDAAGKSGTTNDLRDAWFVGFTPEILTAVWVGFDNNQPIGLSGSQAALPIWTTFMKRATAGRPNKAFEVPPGIVYADIDKDTGQLATPNCPHVFHEAFLAGTVPTERCQLHESDPVTSFFSRLGGLFRRIVR